ncbi:MULTISPECIES: methylenetetrahydrofolate reductase [Streptomyces]|uniref:Methylenetetrahydrofolate reductase n=1 Tax=Streptomyces clavifer TaxID=68188 RepID=A0ABS4VJ15_9ACTN|nr:MULTISPECIES: methylenetetrahydrofolate reductase [Streptomyces]MBP2363872.1 methylenetetrahydrofolate reductase (NADPH) [Streptomyces clavifer]MDX2744684.1 methylenetetrahydrofolate reductase [Streptomyces sp. NRRL_B-2557]GHB08964.1 methylenetetrahydrofolate reductase [Streptomyces clavifer]
MDCLSTTSAPAVAALLRDFSLEMTAKDIPGLEEARTHIPAGTRINVTFLGSEDLAMRLAAARAVQQSGFTPVPHISARRLRSRSELDQFLGALSSDGTAGSVFVIGGDPVTPHGPYGDSLALIRSGLPQKHGVRHVGIAGYPEGHPAIAGPALWSAVKDKTTALAQHGLSGDVITQFGFDAEPVLTWVEEVRKRGIDVPVRVGVPGPAGVRRLMTYAARFGVGTSASLAKKYGFSVTQLMGTAGPERFIRALADGYDERRHGVLKLHFYTFGGLGATSRWVSDFRTGEES